MNFNLNSIIQSPDFFAAVYLLAAVLFILGIKGLASPATARRGNLLSMLGMALAVGVTLIHPSMINYNWALGGMAVGGTIGVIWAAKVAMTSMPQMVAILNSLVGLSAVFVSAGTLLAQQHGAPLQGSLTEIALGSILGAITFTGSVLAFAKLQGIFRSAPVVYKGQHFVNIGAFLGVIGLTVYFAMTGQVEMFYALTALAFLLGILVVIPIGGADMPVVVSVLNCYSGWAAAATGFTLDNMLLVVGGALVGASGAILSYIMCKAMNRSIFNVLLGGFGEDSAEAGEMRKATDKGVKQAAVEDAAFMMENSGKVVIVPGYGMAVAQAQHAMREVMELLEAKGVSVKFAIHPVAGRMPGHMNVLLAEADVPYDRAVEMDEINNEFSSTDVVLVVGANDVVNPDAKEMPSSPLYGMPILEAYKAKQVYVVKRSMRSGYAGVENSLFFADNTYLVFGDAKEVGEKLASSLK